MRAITAALRRRRRFWLTMGAVGLAAGLALTVVRPGSYSATATLWLAHNPSDDQAADMANDVALLQSDAVAQPVIKALGLSLSAQSLLSHYQGVAVSNEVLQITVAGDSPTEALQLATALDRSFLRVRKNLLTSQNRSVIQALTAQFAQLSAQVSTLDVQIGGAKGAKGNGPYATLVAQRDQDQSRLSQLSAIISNDNVNLTTVLHESDVLVGATLLHHSRLKRPLADGASGLITGLALGVGLIAVQAVTSDKIRRRDEFAAALGEPIALSVGEVRVLTVGRDRPRGVGSVRALGAGRFRCTKWIREQLLHRSVKEPGQPVILIARHLRGVMSANREAPSLAIVSVDSSEAAALAVIELARGWAMGGRAIVLVDLSRKRSLGRLLGIDTAGPTEVLIPTTTSRALVVLPPEDDPTAGAWLARPLDSHSGSSTPTPLTPEAVLVFTELDPAVGADDLACWATQAVVVLTAGRSSSTKVQGSAEMLRAAGITIRSAVLVGPDRDDESLGNVTRHPEGGRGHSEAP